MQNWGHQTIRTGWCQSAMRGWRVFSANSPSHHPSHFTNPAPPKKKSTKKKKKTHLITTTTTIKPQPNPILEYFLAWRKSPLSCLQSAALAWVLFLVKSSPQGLKRDINLTENAGVDRQALYIHFLSFPHQPCKVYITIITLQILKLGSLHTVHIISESGLDLKAQKGNWDCLLIPVFQA